jgi:hypothetical protein
MAQSIEGRLARYIHDNLARLDMRTEQVALASTSWAPAIKARLLRFVIQVIHLHAIDYDYGNFTPEDRVTLRRFSVLNRFIKSAENPLDLTDSEV